MERLTEFACVGTHFFMHFRPPDERSMNVQSLLDHQALDNLLDGLSGVGALTVLATSQVLAQKGISKLLKSNF